MRKVKQRGRRGKIVAVFIAYNVAQALPEFYRDFPKHLVDDMILVDDASRDGTYALAKKLGIVTYRNPRNLGYGGNLKRALHLALQRGADTIIEIHPDGEYKPSAIPSALAAMHSGAALVLGNRFTSLRAPVQGGMLIWKVLPLRLLNAIDNVVLGTSLGDIHQGFRVYSRALLERVPFRENSDDYLFSFQIIAQAVFHRLPIAEVPVETNYRGEKRGASLKSCLKYTLDTFRVLPLFILAKCGVSIRSFRTLR